MSDSQKRMLQGFAEYSLVDPAVDQCVVGVQPGTRLMRIVRLPYGWRLWLATRDYIHGTFMEVCDSGRVTTYISRADEGDEIIEVRPTDEDIRARRDRHE